MRIKQPSTVRRYDSDPDCCSPEFGRQLRDSSLQRIGRSKLREFGNCKLPDAANDTICKLFRHVAGAIVFCGSTTMIRSLSAAVHFCVKSNNALRRISSLRFIETVGLRKRTFFCDCSGSTVPIVAIAMTALIGFASLGTEVGVWYGVRRDMQGATDAAAYSAALAKNRPPGTPTIVDAQARSVTAQQGYKDGSNGVAITVNNPPVTGPYRANPFAVEVILQQPQTALLAALFTKGPVLQTRSVSVLTSSKNCIYIMNANASRALDMASGANINVSCGVVVNSSSNQAAAFNGNITIPTVDIVGGYSGTINSKVTTGVAPVTDPLYYVPAPTWLLGSCDKIGYSVSSGAVSIKPGVYCGGINISGSANVTALPGTYILMGGGLNVAGGKLSGTGVTFYNTGNMIYSYAPIQMQNSPIVSLAAPTSGSLSGILFFQDRSISSNLPNGVMGSLTGALYFLHSPLSFDTGSSVKDAYTIVVADRVSFNLSDWSVSNDYSSLSNGSPLKRPKMVE